MKNELAYQSWLAAAETRERNAAAFSYGLFVVIVILALVSAL